MSIFLASFASLGVYSFVSHFGGLAARHRLWSARNALVVLVALQLILILSLRSPSVGVDVIRYAAFFEAASSGDSSNSRYEIGFVGLNLVVSAFSSSLQVFLAVVAVLSVVPVAFVVARYSTMAFLSWAIYLAFNFYGFTFSGLRQAIAIAIVFLAFDRIRARRLVPFILLVALAFAFHRSAAVFAGAYPLYWWRPKPATMLVPAVLAALMFAFRFDLYHWFSRAFFPELGIFESDSYNWLLLSALIFGLSLLGYRGVKREDPAAVGLYNLVGFGCMLMLFASVGTNVMRMADYYYMFVILLIPQVVQLVSDCLLRAVVAMSLVLVLLLVFLALLPSSAYEIVPYRFFWH